MLGGYLGQVLLIGLSVLACAGILAAYLFVRGDADARRFSWVCLFGGAYAFPLIAIYLWPVIAVSHLIFVTGALLLMAITHFSIQFGGSARSRSYLGLLPIAAVAMLTPTGAFVTGVSIVDGMPEPVPGRWIAGLVIAVLASCAHAVRHLWRATRKTEGIRRTQAWLILAALITLMASVLFFNVILPAVGVTSLNRWTPGAVVLFLGCVSYALTTTRLFDVHGVLMRGSDRLLLPAFMVAGALMAAIASNEIAGSPAGGWIATGAACGALVAELSRRRTLSALYSALYPDSLTEDEALGHAVSRLSSADDAPSLVTISDDLFLTMFSARDARARTWQPADVTGVVDGVLVIAVPGAKTYLLDARRDGQPYTGRDLSLARRLAVPLRAAHERVSAREAELDARRRGERQLVADLAHGLLTPLAALRARLEQGEDASTRLHDVDVMIRRVRMLVLVSGQERPLRAIPLVPCVKATLDAYRREYPGLAIESRLDGATCALDEPAFVMALGELLDNARVHAGAHELFISGARVVEGYSLTLAYADPHADALALQDLVDHPWRRTGVRGGHGMGLGLALAATALRAHGASLRFVATDGLVRASFTLPS